MRQGPKILRRRRLDVTLETLENRKKSAPGRDVVQAKDGAPSTDHAKPTFALNPETPTPTKSRFIPSAVRRTVWRRDGGRCRYADPENLRLLCAAHHRLVTERMFGPDPSAPPKV